VASRKYRLEIAAPAQRAIERLPERLAAAVLEFALEALLESPKVVGKPLRGELTGLWVARRGPYRVVYEIDSKRHVIAILRIEHRADVYRPR